MSGQVMSPRPRITIVTPSFNQGQFIEQTIVSVLSQDYDNVEYIVRDGGSTDGTRDVLTKYRVRFAFCVSEKDKGQTDALIKGFSHATGDIWGWLCADDVLLPGALSRVASDCSRDGWLVGSAQVMDESGGKGVVVAHDRYRRGDVLFNSYILSQVSVFWGASLYGRVRGLTRELFYCMDWDLWTQFEEVAAPKVIPDTLAAFRVHAAAKTAAPDRMWKEIWSIRDQRLRGRQLEKLLRRSQWKVRARLGNWGLGAGVGHHYHHP